MRKPTIYICGNKDADQLRSVCVYLKCGNKDADPLRSVCVYLKLPIRKKEKKERKKEQKSERKRLKYFTLSC